jgi:hypothetical protein
MSDAAKSQSVIELSTVFFCEGALPHTIALKDSGLRMRGMVPDALVALYGHQSKQDGFMAAREYADKHRLQFTVIDFLVALDHRINPGLTKPEEWANHDFLAFQRLSRGALDAIGGILQEALAAEAGFAKALDVVKPASLLQERPELVTVLLEHPLLRHVKAFAHPALPEMCTRALNVGTLPFRHWDAVVEATCRLNPTTRVTLERPDQAERSAPSTANVPVARPRPTPPRAR